MRRWTQPTAPSSLASSGNLPHHEKIDGRHPDQCLRASTAKCGRPHHNLSDFPIPPFPDPKPRIPNPGMAYGKDRTSNVSPWGDRTSNVRWVSWRTGTGREGRKEAKNLEPMDWPTMAKKKPQGDYQRGREGNEALSYSRSEASAERSIKRKQKRQRARKPRARRRGFTAKHEQRFHREGSRSQIPVSKGYSTVESIALSSLRTQNARATGARPHGGLRPRSIRGGRVLSGFRVRRKLLCGPQACWSGRGIGWRLLAWQGVAQGSNQTDDQQNGRTPVGTCPVGLHHASLRTTSGRGGIKGSVAHESEDRVFIRGVHALVFEDFGCGNAVGIAGLGLHVFHGFIGRQLPAHPSTVTQGMAGEFTRSLR
jgi:hypothetical protein